MDLHNKYFTVSTTDVSILEIIDTAFKNDPFEFLHRLILHYNGETIKNNLNMTKLRTLRAILCYEYQLRYNSEKKYMLNDSQILGFQNVEDILFAQNSHRSMSEASVLYDIVLLQLVLHCNFQCIKEKLIDFQKSINVNVISNDAQILYVKTMECFLEALLLHSFLFNRSEQIECKELISLYMRDIKNLLTMTEDIEWKALATIIPKLITAFKHEDVAYSIWDLTLNDLNDIKDTLTALSMMSDIFFSKKDRACNIYYDLYCKNRFWSLIISGLNSMQQYRKYALFLMRKATDFMEVVQFKTAKSEKSTLIPFMCDKSDKQNIMENIKYKFFLVLEALEEKQTHLITPALSHLPSLIKDYQEHKTCGDCFNVAWLHCIFKKILKHENNTIVKEGLLYACSMDTSFYNDEFIELMVHILNNTFLYEKNFEEDKPKIVDELVVLFVRMEKHRGNLIEKFFYYMSQMSWGSVALFYVTHAIRIAISKMQDADTWKCNDIVYINTIKALVLTNLNMHSPILRIAFHIEILKIISYSLKQLDNLTPIAMFLSVFPSEEVLKRGTSTWDTIVEWLSKTVTETNALNFINENCQKYIQGDPLKLNIKAFTLMTFLLYDANLVLHCKSYSTTIGINSWLHILIQADSRPYSDMKLIINVIEFISYFLSFCATENCNSIKHLLSLYLDTVLRFIIKNLKKAATILCYEDLNGYLTTITTIFSNANLIISEKEILNYVDKLHTEAVHILENVDNTHNIQYICGLYLLHLSQNMSVSLPVTKCDVDPILNIQKLRISSDSEYYPINLKGKIMSNCYKLLAELTHLYFKKVPAELFDSEINWYENTSHFLQVGGKDIVPIIANILRVLVDKNAIKCLNDLENLQSVFKSCWTCTFLHKKDSSFWMAVQNLTRVIINPNFLTFVDAIAFTKIFVDQLIEEGNNMSNLKRILLTEMKSLKIHDLIYFQESLLSCLLHGYAFRRDKRIENQARSYVANYFGNSIYDSTINHNNDATVRAQAVVLLCKIITMDSEYVSKFLSLILVELEKNENKRYFHHSYLHRVKHRIMQVLLILEPALNMECSVMLQETLFHLILTENDQHSVRLMQEWLLIKIFIKNENLHDKLWAFYKESLLKRPGCTSSIASIVYHIATNLSGDNQYCFIQQSMPFITRCCLGQQFNMRLYNQIIFMKLYELSKHLSYHHIILEYKGLYNALLENLQQQGNTMKNWMTVQEDFYLSIFHPVNDYSLQTIYFELPRLTGMDIDEWISPNLFETLNFVDVNNHFLRLYNINQLLTEFPSNPIASGSQSTLCIKINDDGLSDIQKKITPLKASLCQDEILIRMTQPSTYEGGVEGIIIMASLVERPANLGGLARTCEIFGIKELVIGNFNYIKDKEFQSLSVSSEKWINITEIKPYHMQEYLLEKRNMGWSLIGIEQTANSTSILDMKFTKKTIFVLGNERSGIPPNVIPFFDTCVEIPQIGLTRSLNVHVTGAICIWQYMKQHIFI